MRRCQLVLARVATSDYCANLNKVACFLESLKNNDNFNCFVIFA